MTIEEAIKILEYPVKKWSMEWDEREDGLSYYEALDLAISALRQQETVTNRNGLNEPLTNAQKIRAMSDEELMKLHYSGSAHCIADDPTVCDRHDFIGNLTPCEQCYLKWLQMPADEDDHDERKENENVRR